MVQIIRKPSVGNTEFQNKRGRELHKNLIKRYPASNFEPNQFLAELNRKSSRKVLIIDANKAKYIYFSQHHLCIAASNDML